MYYLCTEPKAIFFTLRFLPVELIERSDRDGYLLSFFYYSYPSLIYTVILPCHINKKISLPGCGGLKKSVQCTVYQSSS